MLGIIIEILRNKDHGEIIQSQLLILGMLHNSDCMKMHSTLQCALSILSVPPKINRTIRDQKTTK